ncbi:MAG: hypothetical protein JWM10_2572 [Myxococcaceae bacterium]|nr:hypothetical protein [Myxococcaceae bacterium]
MNERDQVQIAARCGATTKMVSQVVKGKPTTLGSRVLVILGARNAGLEDRLPASAWEGTELVFPGGRGAAAKGGE